MPSGHLIYSSRMLTPVRRHQKWRSQFLPEDNHLQPQWDFALMVDKESLDSVLEEVHPTEWGLDQLNNSQAHVIIIDMSWFDEDDLIKRQKREDPDMDTTWHGQDDVGWRKVTVPDIYPRLFAFCLDYMYEATVHQMPPEIARIP